MEHILNLETQEASLYQLFEQISSGNTILFLGAGSSITSDKGFLSKHIIKYYEARKGIKVGVDDIIQYVDILSSNENFNRLEFDNFVDELLRKLNISETHKIIASIPWRQIITTNYDILIEKAYDEIKNSSKFGLELKPVRSLKEYSFSPSNDQVKYIKLNGCITDKKAYPLVFSTKDFDNSKSYYKAVLRDLLNLSDKITFLSVGYSFTDDFSKQLLDKFDKFNWRNKRWMYSVDPYVSDTALSYYTDNKICIIKTSSDLFFKKYTEWHENYFTQIQKSRQAVFFNNFNTKIDIAPEVAVRLDNNIVQLNTNYKSRFIEDVDFYKGEEPTYNIILRNIDVIRKDKIDKTLGKLYNAIDANVENILIPLYFFKGTFGTGKTTFTYRLINSFLENTSRSSIAFEITDPSKLRIQDLKELFIQSKAKNILLFCNYVEQPSIFSSLLELRLNLSIEQFSDFNIIFLIPIRENILERYKNSKNFDPILEDEIDWTLTDDEMSELIDKLSKCKIIEYRDAREKKLLLKKIREEYESDSFVMLSNLISDGKHVDDLRSAYYELNESAKKAFVYTSLLYQFKILMPATLLNNLISKDWAKFRKNVIEVDCKGILINETVKSTGTDPDLYFRTKHFLIAKQLIEEIIPNEDNRYEYFKKIFHQINFGLKNSKLAVDLLKVLKFSNSLNQIQINKLFDICNAVFSDEPYFLLYYAINLQFRGGEDNLNKALNSIIYAESLQKWRNHKFIHRRAVINFELAKLSFSKEGLELNFTLKYIEEATQLFIIKQTLDPCSSYSFIDFIKMQLWCLKNFIMDKDAELRLRIAIDENFDLASKSVFDNMSSINVLKSQYISEFKGKENDYRQYLLDKLDDAELRPYILILLYNYYVQENKKDDASSLVSEIESYLDNNEIVKFLFKYYGRNLFLLENRLKFFQLIKDNPKLEDRDSLRYNYFNFIAESYNKNFTFARDFQHRIKYHFKYLNPEFHSIWSNEEGIIEIFNGFISTSKSGFKIVKIPDLQESFPLLKGDYTNIDMTKKYTFKLHFYLYGIRAEIVDII